MEIRSSSCGWRRVQEAGAGQGNSSKWQHRGGIWGSWKPPKQGKGERCPSIFSSDFCFASFMLASSSPKPSVRFHFNPRFVLVPQPDPTSWPIKLINYPSIPTPPHPTFSSSVHQEILLQPNHCGVWKDQTGFYFISATILLCYLVYVTFYL